MPVMPGETDLHDLAPTRGQPTVHRSQVHCLGDTPIAIDLRSSSTGPSEQAKEKAMKAIRCREWGAPETLRLEEAESPKLQPHQVRIRVRAAGVNFADTLMGLAAATRSSRRFPLRRGLKLPARSSSPALPSPTCGRDNASSRCCALVAATPRRSCSTLPRWCRFRRRWIS